MLSVLGARPAPLCLEAVPPLIDQGGSGVDGVLQRVAALHEAVGLDAVNIPEIREESSKSAKGERLKPFRPRVEPRVLAWEIQERLGIPCMINRVVVHGSVSEQADWLRETWECYGVRRYVLVGGEHSSQRYPGPSVPEANELIREVIDDAGLQVGNICIPTRAGEAARMRDKLETGVGFFTSQIIYHANDVTGLLNELAGCEVSSARSSTLMLSLCPIRSQRNIRFLHWLGVSLSAALEEWLLAGPERPIERSVVHLTNLWRDIEAARAQPAAPLSLGVCLAPIGRIPNDATIRLAQALMAEC